MPSYITYDGYQEQTQPGSATFTDTNGNQISASSTKVFTDTMGETVLTVSGAAPNPVIYTYTDPNGHSQQVTVNYTIKTVQTAFNVSGVVDVTTLNVPLVSSIVYSGDGSSYSFNYEEPNPGNHSIVTGRIDSITLRTGGTIGYAYTGGSNGIEPDGTTAGLTRTTSDGQTKYTRPEITSSTSYTSTQDALGNVTMSAFLINSGGYFYETDHAVYSGGRAAHHWLKSRLVTTTPIPAAPQTRLPLRLAVSCLRHIKMAFS